MNFISQLLFFELREYKLHAKNKMLVWEVTVQVPGMNHWIRVVLFNLKNHRI